VTSLISTLDIAQQHLAKFESMANGLDYERKGVLFSEMFFLYAAAQVVKPKRILESGRARGQSTLLLSYAFPEAKIISVEHDKNSPDVRVAQARLADRSNVELLFGDATKILPQKLERGDVVLIDGPKGFRGLRLAFRLLMTDKPSLIFIHDCPLNSPERAFLDRHISGVFHSDAQEFVRNYAHLDQIHSDTKIHTPSFDSTQSYGFVFSCIPYHADMNYSKLLLRLAFTTFFHRMKNSWNKRFGH